MRLAWLALLAFACGCLGGGVESGCDARTEAAARGAIERLNFCTTRDDCVIDSFGCPFGCVSLVNRYADLADARNRTETYHAACPECKYKCPAPPEEGDIQCVGGVCVDVRYAPTTTAAPGERGIVRDCEYTMGSNCKKCYCMEAAGGCDIVDWSLVGDLKEYVGRNVTYEAERANLKCTRMCPCRMSLTGIVAQEEPAAVAE